MVRDAIGTILRARASSTPDRVCCAMDDNVFTYAEMDQRSDALAAGLAQLGAGRGEQVAMLAPNRIELLEVFYGAAKTRAAQVPLNAYLKGEFLLHWLEETNAGRGRQEDILAPLPGIRARSFASSQYLPYSGLDSLQNFDFLGPEMGWVDGIQPFGLSPAAIPYTTFKEQLAKQREERR